MVCFNRTFGFTKNIYLNCSRVGSVCVHYVLSYLFPVQGETTETNTEEPELFPYPATLGLNSITSHIQLMSVLHAPNIVTDRI